MKLYHLISVNNKTGKITYLTGYPMIHAKCMIMKSKNTVHPFRTITVLEV
jgi:hypothetical protein